MNEIDFTALDYVDIDLPVDLSIEIPELILDNEPIITKSKKRVPRNYINNEDFCKSLIEYKAICAECEQEEKVPPKIPNYIGECWMKIAQNFARKPEFFNYPYKDEAINDAIVNCILYWKNFDPEVSRNAFSYFSQYAYFAFIRRINQEHGELYVKYKATESFFTLDEEDMYDTGTDNPLPVNEIYNNMKDFISKFEEKQAKKELLRKEKQLFKPSTKITLDRFLEG